MDPITQLFAIEQIKLIKARYFRFVDTKNWHGLRSVFTEDAVIEIPEAVPDAKSRDDAIAFMEAAVEGSVSIHFGHMPEIEILDDHSATGVWPMDDRIYWPDDRAAILGYTYLRGFGHYHETYQRIGREWKIRTMRLTRLRLITQRPPLTVS